MLVQLLIIKLFITILVEIVVLFSVNMNSFNSMSEYFLIEDNSWYESDN